MPDRILIIKLSSLGDVLHTLPAAQLLRRAFPKAEIGWAVDRTHADLVRDQEFLDRVIEWDRGSLRSLGRFVAELRRTSWNLAIDFQGLLRSAMVARLSGAQSRVGYTPAREGAAWLYNRRVPLATMDRHAVDRSLDLARAACQLFGASEAMTKHPADPMPFPLIASSEVRASADAWLARHEFDARVHSLVALNPHCRKAANRWPAERFAELAARLAKIPSVRIVLVGGGVAGELCESIAHASGQKLWRADGQLSLLGTAELFRHCRAVVTGDTGPMHIAVAVQAPVVALFGPANPVRTGPYSTDAIVLRKSLPCSPCYARSACPLGHALPPCMGDISVDEVYRAVERQLAASGAVTPLRKIA